MLKRFTSLVVAVAMVVTLISVTPSQADAAIKIMYGKKLNLNIGKKDEIMVKGGGATFKSSNKKVAKVNSKGVVKATGAGTCKITVSKGGETVKTTVKVTPAQIKDVAAQLTSPDANSIQVTWTKAKKVTGYQVSYSLSQKSGYKSVKVKGAKKTSTVIEGLELGKTYYFKVRAYAKSGKKTINGKYSKVASANTWKMVWNDEFNSTTLDRTKWDFQLGGGGFGNHELQEYTDTNYAMDGSNFIIKPQFKWNKSTGKAESGSYKSTKIWTKDLYSVTYGRIEFRAKLPKAQGTWAAAWMLGINNAWPLCGEIDILETTSQLEKTRVPQSIHCRKFNGMTGNQPNKHYDSTIADATTAFHTYGIIWTEDMIQFTIDGKVTGTYDPAKLTFADNPLTDTTVWPFNQPFYLIMNCAIGGTLGGSVGTYGWTEIASEGNLVTYEDYYYIDWVRVYQ